MSEHTQFLSDHPEIEFIDVLVPDMCNVIRGKRIPVSEVDKLFGEGLQIAASIMLLDITGECTDAGGRGFSDGDPDVTIRPVPGTLVPVPWGSQPTAQVLGSLFELDGSPCLIDPRHVLAGVLDRFKEFGLNPVVATELEFYLLDGERAGNGEVAPPMLPQSGRRAWATQVYSIGDLDGFSGFLREVDTVCVAQQLPVGAATAEYAIGQYEINLKHVDDGLAAADHGLLLQRVIKNIAQNHGAAATFMAKPYPGGAGNGLHVHLSLFDEAGNNVFDDGTETGSEMLRHAVAGLLATMGEAFAFFAPNVNSYRRFAPNLYVPTTRSWGYNNRSVAVRIPTGSTAARRLEHRVAGADANPYLTLAAILAGVHHGITHKIEPEPPRSDNASDILAADLPFRWQEALEALKRAEILPRYFGGGYCELFRESRQFELDNFASRITPLEYDWYLQTD